MTTTTAAVAAIAPKDYSSPDLIMTPIAVESRIRSIADSILRGADIVHELRVRHENLKVTYDLAFARASMAAEGPMYARRWRAEEATHELRQQLAVAYTAYRHGADKLDALKSELRAYQSVGASIRAAYKTAGRGEF